MNTAKQTIPANYLKLMLEFPLRPIRTKADYGRAAKMIDQLASRDETDLDQGERDYLDVLSTLVEEYDAAHFVIETADFSPRDVLLHLMESRAMSQADVGRVLGNRSIVSMILSGKREMSKMHIGKLASFFAVSPSVFFVMPVKKPLARAS